MMKSTPAATVEHSQKSESVRQAADVDFDDVIRLVSGGVYLCRAIGVDVDPTVYIILRLRKFLLDIGSL